MKQSSSVIDNNIPFLFISARHTDVECVTHIHVNMEIILVTEGVLEMTIGGRDYSIPKGFGAFVSVLEPHRFHSKEPNQCHVLMFSKELGGSFSEFTEKHYPKNHVFAVSDACMEFVNRILPHLTNVTDPISVEAVLAPLCYEIYTKCEFEERKSKLDRTAFRILEYVNAHFLEPLTLEGISKAVKVHPVTVSRIFSHQIGGGFCYYLQYLRCTYAAKLIKTQDLSFSEVAYEAGFHCIRSFNRAFLNIYRITPTEYKCSYREV